jgi:hypothetical protein
MDDLRNEIRAAFEREQAAHPPDANLRQTTVRAVTTRPTRRRDLQWLAAVATLMIAVLVVVSLIASRLSTSGPVDSHTAPAGDYGPPPAGVDLIWVGDPAHPGWYIGLDSTGKPRGTIKLAQPLDDFHHLVQAADGSGFILEGIKASDGIEMLDRLGHPDVGFPIPVGMDWIVWADDSRHLCSLATQDGHVLLSWSVPRFTSDVAIVAPAPRPSGGVGANLRSCSFLSAPLAVFEEDKEGQIPTPTAYAVRSLADGHVLAQGRIGAGVANTIIVSHDSEVIALNSLKSDGFPAPTAPSTVVKNLSTGETFDLDPSLSVMAFSWDDEVALATTSDYAGYPTALQAIELSTGKVTWRYGGGQELVGAPLVQPDGDFVLFLRSPKDQALHPKIDVVIVHRDGTATQVAGEFVLP